MTPYGLTAPSHYLNQWWLTISKVQHHSPEGTFTRDTSAINCWNQPENTYQKFHSNLPGANELEHSKYRPHVQRLWREDVSNDIEVVPRSWPSLCLPMSILAHQLAKNSPFHWKIRSLFGYELFQIIFTYLWFNLNARMISRQFEWSEKYVMRENCGKMLDSGVTKYSLAAQLKYDLEVQLLLC